jgi:GNAT superfamily N-acetyltransferase
MQLRVRKIKSPCKLAADIYAQGMPTPVHIVSARERDVSEILRFIRLLAHYEKLEHQVSVTEEKLRDSLFGCRRYAEVVFIEENGVKVGFALFFHNYSTFLGKPGIYLEDLFVLPEHRGKGYGKKLLAHLAQLALQRGCGRLEWSVLNWNQPAIDFYLSLKAEPLKEWTIYRLSGLALESLGRIQEPLPPA